MDLGLSTSPFIIYQFFLKKSTCRPVSNLEYRLVVPDSFFFEVFCTKSVCFVNFLSGGLSFKLFLESKKEFSSCSQGEICKFQRTRTRRTLTQVCRFSAYLGLSCQPLGWLLTTALSGRGSFAFIVLRHAEPHLGKCNDSRLFCFHT